MASLNPKFHIKEGAVTYWSVYEGGWRKTFVPPPPEEFAAMGERMRAKIIAFFAKHGKRT